MVLCKVVGQFLKKLNSELPHDPEISLMGIYPPKGCMDLNRYLYTHAHRSIIQKSQKVEVPQVSING